MEMRKDMNNLEIAELLRAIAAAYQLKNEGSNRFKIVAYERAADAIEHSSSELKDVWDEGKLEDVPSIGKSIAEHLDELFRTGTSKHFEEILKGLPKAMFELMEVPGIGPKTAFKLVTKLNLKSLKDLEDAASKGKIANLTGFGEESQTDILKSIGETKKRVKRHLLPYAEEVSREIIEWILKDVNVKRADSLGSQRRKAATVGDIDISASTNNPKNTIEHLSKYPNAKRVLEKGERTSSIILPSGIQVDLMVERPSAYGALLQHFTGSKHHNIALREYALKKGLSLSDYGIYVKSEGKKILKKIATEEEFYNFLKMDWIPPELREDTGEIEAALKHQLPKLVDIKDIKSDLQIHSNFDIETSHDLGESSMEEIIEVVGRLGYEYVAMTEHNPSRGKHTNKQIVEILKRKREIVDEINYSIKIPLRQGFVGRLRKVFNSLEIDMLSEGGLPVPEEGLATLDFALVSIHSSFDLNKKKMTERVLKSMEHPKVKIFAHPTARKINYREGVELDWPEIFGFCIKNNKWIEINCDPMRLDLPDMLVKDAVKNGVKLTLGTDAHHKDGLNNMKYGVYVARRGWTEKNDIVNTRSLEEFESMLK